MARWLRRQMRVLQGASPSVEGASLCLPYARVLLAVLDVLLGLNQLQRLLSHLLVFHFVVQVPEILNDVIPDQSAVLLGGTFSEAGGKPIHHDLLRPLSCSPDL